MTAERPAKLPVAVLGATGVVGQRLVSMLDRHPWFELAEVAASERRAGSALGDAWRWLLPEAPPPAAARMALRRPDPAEIGAPLVLSALDAGAAREIEPRFAAAGRAVVSNAAAHRMADGVPLVVPEVNAGHLVLVEGRRGFIVANPNCSTIVLALALAPLVPLGIESVVVSTLQAVSGAGYPGVPALDVTGNALPFIAGEEEKIEAEPRKILGRVEGGTVVPADIAVSASAHRVPVRDGHLLSVAVRTRADATAEQARRLFRDFRGDAAARDLPSSPERPLFLREEQDRPQPALDAAAGAGMAVSIGRVRPCPVLGLRFAALGHNTVRGAAGGTLLIAELLAAKGLLPCS